MRSKRFLVCFVLLAVILSAGAGIWSAGPATAGPKTVKALRWKMFSLVNASRRHHDRRPLRLCGPLSFDALRHSRRMADTRSVFHTSDLYSLVRPYRPRHWGENVGMAGTTRRTQRLFMRSRSHRRNILSSHFRHIGVGVVRSGGRVWVTLDFYGG